jgi:hypothetical protein
MSRRWSPPRSGMHKGRLHTVAALALSEQTKLALEICCTAISPAWARTVLPTPHYASLSTLRVARWGGTDAAATSWVYLAHFANASLRHAVIPTVPDLFMR